MDVKEYNKQYYKKNKNKILKSVKKWNESNPDKVKRYIKKSNNSLKAQIRRSKWINENPLKDKIAKENWKKLNPENRALNQKRYSKRHPEKIKAQQIATKIPLKSCCEICYTTTNLERHHFDYTRPRLFNTLCKKCHTLKHLVGGGI